MKTKLIKNITAIGIASLCFFVSIGVEKIFMLQYLAIWFLVYLAGRGIRPHVVIFLCIFYDLLYFHPLGLTFLYICLIMVVIEFVKTQIPSTRLRWLICCLGTSAWVIALQRGGLPHFGFWISTFIFTLMYLVGFGRIRKLVGV